ncbi:hypothetical protein [Pelobium manganitolerans]|uniref:hypothetical protein n=1 Tax=Pelobium manganitolerans TaxID=1842495 RepID=UPI00160262CC|nr:hypothetical protein [Pelobium manganitolerans]
MKNQKVKINPFLTTDPYNKRGQIGEVTECDGEVATVLFEDGITGKYQTDTLELVSS